MHKPEVLREKFDESLRELGTGYVDIFYLNGPDRGTPWAKMFHVSKGENWEVWVE